MKKAYTAPLCEKVHLDPLMDGLGAAQSTSSNFGLSIGDTPKDYTPE